MADFLDQRKLEDLLAFTTKTCTASVAVGGIPSVAEEAADLLEKYQGNVAAAAEQAARVEEVGSWKEKLPDVLLPLVPIVGDSTLGLRWVWRSIRRCALIAHLYGHDLSSTETQAMILTCLISVGNQQEVQGAMNSNGKDDPNAMAAALRSAGVGAVAAGSSAASGIVSVGGRLLALSVSRAVLREVFVRGTGLRYAAMMYNVAEKASFSLGRRLRSGSPPPWDKGGAAAATAGGGGATGSDWTLTVSPPTKPSPAPGAVPPDDDGGAYLRPSAKAAAAASPRLWRRKKEATPYHSPPSAAEEAAATEVMSALPGSSDVDLSAGNSFLLPPSFARSPPQGPQTSPLLGGAGAVLAGSGAAAASSGGGGLVGGGGAPSSSSSCYAGLGGNSRSRASSPAANPTLGNGGASPATIGGSDIGEAVVAAGEELSAAKVALVMFRPPNAEERPEVLAGLVFVWLLPILVAALRFAWERLVPFFARRVQMELSIGHSVLLILVAQLFGFLVWLWIKQNRSIFASVPATLVFVIYALLPGISTFMATRSMIQGVSEAYFFMLLGVFNLIGGYLRYAEDLRSDAELEQRSAPFVASAREQAESFREYLWLLLSIDFVLEELLGRVFRLHSLRLLGPPSSNTNMTLFEYRTLAFAMGLAAAWSQTRVLDLLQRRTVLMRLLGAKHAMTVGASLLLMGISAVSQYKTTVSWLVQVSPSPHMCCLVLWIRQWGAIFGAVLPLALSALLHPSFLGALSTDTLVPLAIGLGAFLGHCFSWSIMRIWWDKGEHLESDYRVLYLFPKTSANGRRLASNAMQTARRHCTDRATSTAVEWAASRIVRKGFDVFATRMLAA